MTENGDDMNCIALVSYSANGEAICRDGVRSDKRARKKIRATRFALRRKCDSVTFNVARPTHGL